MSCTGGRPRAAAGGGLCDAPSCVLHGGRGGCTEVERGSHRGLRAVSYTREEGHSSCVMHQRRELQAVSCTRVEEGSRGGLLALPCTRGGLQAVSCTGEWT